MKALIKNTLTGLGVALVVASFTPEMVIAQKGSSQKGSASRGKSVQKRSLLSNKRSQLGTNKRSLLSNKKSQLGTNKRSLLSNKRSQLGTNKRSFLGNKKSQLGTNRSGKSLLGSKKSQQRRSNTLLKQRQPKKQETPKFKRLGPWPYNKGKQKQEGSKSSGRTGKSQLGSKNRKLTPWPKSKTQPRVDPNRFGKGKVERKVPDLGKGTKGRKVVNPDLLKELGRKQKFPDLGKRGKGSKVVNPDLLKDLGRKREIPKLDLPLDGDRRRHDRERAPEGRRDSHGRSDDCDRDERRHGGDRHGGDRRCDPRPHCGAPCGCSGGFHVHLGGFRIGGCTHRSIWIEPVTRVVLVQVWVPGATVEVWVEDVIGVYTDDCGVAHQIVVAPAGWRTVVLPGRHETREQVEVVTAGFWSTF